MVKMMVLAKLILPLGLLVLCVQSIPVTSPSGDFIDSVKNDGLAKKKADATQLDKEEAISEQFESENEEDDEDTADAIALLSEVADLDDEEVDEMKSIVKDARSVPRGRRRRRRQMGPPYTGQGPHGHGPAYTGEYTGQGPHGYDNGQLGYYSYGPKRA